MDGSTSAGTLHHKTHNAAANTYYDLKQDNMTIHNYKT